MRKPIPILVHTGDEQSDTGLAPPTRVVPTEAEHFMTQSF